mgnify:CR=1 FL=1
MQFLFPLITLFEAAAAVFFLWHSAESDLSILRLAFIGLTVLIAAGILYGWFRFKRGAESVFSRKIEGDSSGVERSALIFLLISLFCLGLTIASGHYYDNPAVDRLTAYLRQATPFLIFCELSGIQLFITIFLRLFQQEERFSAVWLRLLRCGKRVWQFLLIALACLLLMAAFLPIRRNYYPSHDYSIFSYFGQQILKGRIPFLEIWDHKPPVIFYIDALGLFLANGSLLGIWLLEFFSILAVSWILFRLNGQTFTEWIALPVVILSILHYIRLFDSGNYTEEFSLLFQMLALAILFSSRLKKNPYLRAGLSGLCCGLAFTCKQNTIGLWMAWFLLETMELISVRDLCRENFKPFLNRWLIFLSGFLLINGFWAAYFWSKGALWEYWDVAFRYNFVYSGQSSSAGRLAAGWTTFTFLSGFSPFLFFGYIGWIFNVVRDVRLYRGNREWLANNRLLLWALIALPVELCLAGISGMNYQHYFILCIPPLTVLICALVQRFDDFLRPRLAKSVAWVVMIGVLLAASFPLLSLYRESYQPRNPSVYTKAADFLRENSAPDDPVQIWGGGLAAYVMAERSAPTRFFNVRPLYLFPGWMQETQWTQFLSDLTENPPRYILYTNESYMAAVPFVGDGFCAAGSLPDYQKSTYNYLCVNYRFREAINPGMNDTWAVFEYKKE